MAIGHAPFCSNHQTGLPPDALRVRLCALALRRITVAANRLSSFGIGLALVLAQGPALAGDRFQLFVTGVGIEQGGRAYVFTAVKIDNVEGIAWDCSARASTRKGDSIGAHCKRANYQWALTGGADVRSFMAYLYVDNSKPAGPMPAMWQLDSAAGTLQICVNNQYNSTASGCFLFSDD
jgi:hypothetical protein